MTKIIKIPHTSHLETIIRGSIELSSARHAYLTADAITSAIAIGWIRASHAGERPESQNGNFGNGSGVQLSSRLHATHI